MDYNFYNGKKVFLTGHTGFKGSWMLTVLNKFGAKVCGYSLKPQGKDNMYAAIKGDSLCESHIGDISDYDSLLSVMERFQPEIVIHMAAQPIVLESYKNPKYTYQTNVMGTVNILEAIRNVKSVRSFVNVTTDKVYENNNCGRDFVETDPLGGYDPYSNSKACSELVTKSYRSSFFNPENYDEHKVSIATCRAGNVLGGGDFADNRIIPDCARAGFNKEKIIIRNPDAIRPWQHVLEPIFMYLKVAALGTESCLYSDHFNIGPDISQCRPVIDILKCFTGYWGNGLEYEITVNANALHEAKILRLDTTKSKKVLGYKPVFDVDRTIKTAVEWYKAYMRGENMLEVTQKQIEEFLR